MVIDHHMYIIGGTSEGEIFRDPDKIGTFLTDKTCETCCTYNMLKLTKQLFMHDPKAEYMDYYERGLYNHILASQHDQSNHGFTTYFVPLKPGAKKRYSNDYHSFSCCHGTGMENHTKYGECIYFHKNDTLWINLFIPSELTWKRKNITIRQETGFPEEQGSTFIIGGNQTFSIKIRRPFWAQDGFSIRINDVVQSKSTEPGTYVTIHRNWRDGDKISVDLPFQYRVEYTPDVTDVGGIMYGPVLLGGENINSLVILNLDHSNLMNLFIEDENDPLHFTFQGISFQPFYRIHDTPYSVYFNIPQ